MFSAELRFLFNVYSVNFYKKAEIAAMVGRREERRRLAEEEVERRNRANKHNKRSKSKDRGIIDLKGNLTFYMFSDFLYFFHFRLCVKKTLSYTVDIIKCLATLR